MSKKIGEKKRKLSAIQEEEECEIEVEENEYVKFEIEKNIQKLNNWQVFEKKEIGKKIQILPRCLHKLPCVQKGIQFMCVYSKNVGKNDAVKMCKFTAQIKHINQWMNPGFIKNPEGTVTWDFCKTCKTATLGELSFPNQANSYFPSIYCSCKGPGMRVSSILINQEDNNNLYDYATFKAYQTNKNEENSSIKMKKIENDDVFVPEEEN